MKKYIRAGICLVYSFIKFSLIKTFHLKHFRFTALNLISPFTEIEIGNKAKLSIGKMVRIKSGSKIKVRNGAEVFIGDNTSLNHGCMIISHDKIIVGKDVQFGPNVLIYDHDHDYKAIGGIKSQKFKTAPVNIGNNVWIGANSIILRDTEIGDNCVVAAGSVLKGKFESNTLIYQKRMTNSVFRE